jgi:hypothetical protein
MSRHALSRRTLLRGAAGAVTASIGLPMLEAMLHSNGEALANGEALPGRFGLWFWGNGVRPEQWVPGTQGTNWTPSAELEPLSRWVPWLSVISGQSVRMGSSPHDTGMAAVLTGQVYRINGMLRDTVITTVNRQTVDQDAADQLAQSTRLRSLEVGVWRFTGTEQGSLFQHVSHNGPDSPNPADRDPASVFHKLVGSSEHGRVRGSMLDLIADDLAALQRKVGHADRARLDQHLTSLRAVERRLEAPAPSCGLVQAPALIEAPMGLEQVEAQHRQMAELIALALACDLTRVFTVQFSACAGNERFWQLGSDEGLHVITHLEPMPQPTIHAATTLTMGCFADLLDVFQRTPDGAGTLLDNVSVLATSDVADGFTHSNDDYPMLIAGGGAGRLQPGTHLRTQGSSVSRGVLTALHGAGVALPSWGVAQGRETEPYSELLG